MGYFELKLDRHILGLLEIVLRTYEKGRNMSCLRGGGLCPALTARGFTCAHRLANLPQDPHQSLVFLFM